LPVKLAARSSLLFGRHRQSRLGPAEFNGDGLGWRILVKAADGAIQLVDLAGGLTREGICLLGLLVGRGCDLTGLVGGGLSLGDAGLRTGIDILDVRGVLRVDFVQFVDLTLNGVKLAFHPLFAGERIDLAPETFLGRLAHALGGGGGLGR